MNSKYCSQNDMHLEIMRCEFLFDFDGIERAKLVVMQFHQHNNIWIFI